MADLPNNIIRSVNIKDIFHRHTLCNEFLLFEQFYQLLPSLEESALDALFENTIQRVAVGYAWLTKALARSGKKTFLPAVKRLPQWRRLSERAQKVIRRNIRLIKKIFSNWDKIVHHVSGEEMIYVDVRRFSLYQLSRATNLNWVKRYNKSHAPRKSKRLDKLFTRQMIEDIVNNVEGSTETLLDAVDGDEDQIKAIGVDITSLLHEKTDQQFIL